MGTDMQTSGGNGAASNSQATTEAAARIAHDIVDRVAKVAGQSEEKLRAAGANAETSVKQSLETARGKLDVARTNLNTKSSEVKTSVTGFIQEHPFAALGIAFGTGVLLSYLTRGSRRVERDDDSA
ncbi:MAG TPA: hypothetical protein VFM32_06600 [Spongiibacteraceae bacterium]|nr:hypothetical protein [Spongiibacteraceae bacterium]